MQPQPATDDALLGAILADKYRVVRQIGRGGMGIVYEGEHIGLGKRVAIKLMLEKYTHDGEATRRFQREAIAASKIGNPHIIDVIDVGVAADGRSFVVMELLSGLPLSQVIEMTGPLPPWRAVAIMRQVLRAVGAAHAKGIIHRDLKPDNIFIISQDDHHDFVKLLDFGISKMIDPDEQVAFTKLTTTGVVMGTPLYMAPEQAMGMPIERHADLYACGVILYEMLAGKPPFEGATYAHLVAKLITQQPPLLSDVRPGLPGALVTAVHRALEKEPRDRFQSAEQFLATLPGDKTPSMIELAGTLDSSSGQVAVLPQPRLQASRRGLGKKWPLYVVLASAVAAGGVLTFLTLQPADEPAPIAAPTAAPATPVEPAGAAGPSVQPIPEPTATVTTGLLHVTSVPVGATVWVDGVEKGKSPLQITLAPGPYKVRVTLDGHEPSTELPTEVLAKERTSVVLPLGPKLVATPHKSRTRRVETKPAEPKHAGTKALTPAVETPPPAEPKVETKKPSTRSSAGAKPNPY